MSRTVQALRARRESLKDLAGQTGWVNAAWYALARSLESASGGHVRLIKYYLMAQPLAPSAVAGKAAASLTVTMAGPESPYVAAFPRPPQVIHQRFESGAICFVAANAEVFVGFLWLKERQYEEDEVRCLFLPQPAEHAVWDFDVYVEPRFRIGRAFSRLWDAAYAFMRSKDYRWTMSRVSAFNSASLRSHARLGAVRVGSAIFLRIGPLQVSFLGCAPYVHVSVRQSRRPIIKVVAPR